MTLLRGERSADDDGSPPVVSSSLARPMPTEDQKSLQRFWKAVYDSFDPDEPVTVPALRVPRDEKYSPAEQALPSLLSDFGVQRVLVAGAIGSGKSTELLTIAERLGAAGRVVVSFDLGNHMEYSVKDPGAIERLQAWEIVGLVGLAVLRAGTKRWGHAWRGADAALAKALSSQSDGAELDVAKLATGLAVTVGGAVGAATNTGIEVLKAIGDAWSWKLGLPGARRRSDQDEGVRNVVAATKTIIESLSTALDRRIVVIIDGLDRIRRAQGFEGLFVESGLVQSLPCDLVMSAHLAMVQRYRGSLRFDQRYDLCNEPVADREDPWKPDPRGVRFFRELVERRFHALEGVQVIPDVLSEPLLERLVWCSGGRLRDFMGFMRSIALLASGQTVTRVGTDLVERIIDKARRLLSDGLNADEIELLEDLARDPTHRLPGSDLAIELLEQQLILAYPNENAWYLPHPLLMIALIRPG